MTQALACPYCRGAIGVGPGDTGRLRACPWCRNFLLLQDLRLPLAPLYRLRLPNALRRPGEFPGEGWLNVVAVLGISASFIGLLLATLAILAALNAFVPHVEKGVRQALPQVPVPLSKPAMVGSALVVGLLALVVLADMIGLLLRREWARRLFCIAAWFVFAMFLGMIVGLAIMPDSSIQAWTVLVVVPPVAFFALSLRLLHKPEVRRTFH